MILENDRLPVTMTDGGFDVLIWKGGDADKSLVFSRVIIATTNGVRFEYKTGSLSTLVCSMVGKKNDGDGTLVALFVYFREI